MVKIDFGEVVKAAKTPKRVIMTLVVNWAIKPFTMYLFATLFLGSRYRSCSLRSANGHAISSRSASVTLRYAGPAVQRIMVTGVDFLVVKPPVFQWDIVCSDAGGIVHRS